MTATALPGRNNHRIIAFPHLAVSVTAESDALVATTPANWLDVTGWRSPLMADTERGNRGHGLVPNDEQWFESYPQFELDIEADATETITAAELYAVRLGPVTAAIIPADDFTSSGSSAVNTATSHVMMTGDGPFRLTTTDTLPAGLLEDTDYFVEDTGANTFELYLTRALAIASGGGIATTDTGTGTHTISTVQSSANKDDDTRRCRLTLVGRLNSGAATVGSITVGAQTAYMERIDHSPLDLYYALVATVGVAQTLTIRATPVMATEE